MMPYPVTPRDQFLVEGLSALAEYVRHKPSAIKCIFYKAKYKEKVLDLVGTLRIPHQLLEERTSNTDMSVAPVFAHVSLGYQSFTHVTKVLENSQDTNLVLALDHITDPRNLGAIARSAAFFGVKYILLPKMRQVLFTDASVATSQGAFAFSELVLVSNLNQSLEKLKDLGFWIICADSEGEPFQKVLAQYKRVVLLLGSEGKGVSELLKKKSDRIIAIASPHKILDSLNVSVAAGILLQSFSAHTPQSVS